MVLGIWWNTKMVEASVPKNIWFCYVDVRVILICIVFPMKGGVLTGLNIMLEKWLQWFMFRGRVRITLTLNQGFEPPLSAACCSLCPTSLFNYPYIRQQIFYSERFWNWNLISCNAIWKFSLHAVWSIRVLNIRASTQ